MRELALRKSNPVNVRKKKGGEREREGGTVWGRVEGRRHSEKVTEYSRSAAQKKYSHNPKLAIIRYFGFTNAVAAINIYTYILPLTSGNIDH